MWSGLAPWNRGKFEEQGWRSGDRARLPPMWPAFDSRALTHKWVEFVVGSRTCSNGFSPGYQVFLPPQKSTFQNSNSIGNSRATGLSVVWLLCVTLVKTKLIYFFYLFIYASLHTIFTHFFSHLWVGKYNKTLYDWPRGKQWVLFPRDLRTIEDLGQTKLSSQSLSAYWSQRILL